MLLKEDLKRYGKYLIICMVARVIMVLINRRSTQNKLLNHKHVNFRWNSKMVVVLQQVQLLVHLVLMVKKENHIKNNLMDYNQLAQVNKVLIIIIYHHIIYLIIREQKLGLIIMMEYQPIKK